MMSKRNTFTDFLACADALVQSGVTTYGQLVAEGGSAAWAAHGRGGEHGTR